MMGFTLTLDAFDIASELVLDQIQIDLDSIQGDVDRDLVDHVVASAIAQLEGELFQLMKSRGVLMGRLEKGLMFFNLSLAAILFVVNITR